MRTAEEIYADISALVDASGSLAPMTAGEYTENLRRRVGLWGELYEVISADPTVPLWAYVAAGDARRAVEDRLYEMEQPVSRR